MSRRVEEHQKGLNMSCFTFKRRPVKLIFQQEFNEVDQAIYFEKKIKKWSAKKNMLWQMEILTCCKFYQNAGTQHIPSIIMIKCHLERSREVFLSFLSKIRSRLRST
ncbi:GIY-YIG nuclease family protein [Psychroflexus salinarum]|uniref:GIY-YIG nuclease family protein n=1 Tax=Psychroflexus salinarum TaxID=546024 RepID=A0ABW3GMB9_9FLAO